MFRGIWNFVKKNAGAIMGMAIGGPIGALIGSFLDQIINKSLILPPHIEQEIEAWADKVVKPIIVAILADMGATPKSDLNSKNFIDKFNTAIRQLATLKAYYEFKKLSAPYQELFLKYEGIIAGLGSSIEILQESYLTATNNNALPYVKGNISFNPVIYTNVGTEVLNWTGAKSITASFQGYSLPSTGGTTKPGGTTVISKPTTGGTTKPGGIVVVNPPADPTTKPTTGSTITSPGIPTVVTKPIGQQPVNNFKPLPAALQPGTTTPKNNKNKWIAGIAIAAAALFFYKSSNNN